MKFAIDTAWVTALWAKIKDLVSGKQDKITGQSGQVVGFQNNGEPAAIDPEQLIDDVWPDGPYTFKIDDNGHLFVNYAGTNNKGV